jgi:putative hydrolase of the HAD superfamily
VTAELGERRAVVFDIDDTLYLERDYVRSGFAAVGRLVRERTGMPDFAEQAWALFLAGTRRTIFDRILAGYGISPTPSLVGELVECYRRHDPEIALLPDAATALGRLAADPTAAIAVLTDGPLASQQAKATTLELERWAELLVFTDELGPEWSKPSPLAFALVEERLGVAAARCVYVADNPAKDFAGPVGRGWRAVRIRRPESLHAAIDSDPGAGIDAELPDLEPLGRYLESSC